MQNLSRFGKVSLFWDVQNVASNLSSNKSVLLERLLQLSSRYGALKVLKAYGSLGGKKRDRLQKLLFAKSGEYIPITSTKPNALDYQLMDDCIRLLVMGRISDTVILVTGDNDYEFLVYLLQRHKVKVVVVARTGSVGCRLKQIADEFYTTTTLLASDEAA